MFLPLWRSWRTYDPDSAYEQPVRPHPEGRPVGRRHRQRAPAPARGHAAQGRLGPVHVPSFGFPRAEEDREHRARGNGRFGCPGDSHAGAAAGGAVGGKRALERLRPRAHAPYRSSRPRDVPRSHPRGDHRGARAQRAALLQGAAPEPLPNSDEVPRRDSPALRSFALSRIRHEGRLQLQRHPGVAAGNLRRHGEGLRRHLRPLRLGLPRGGGRWRPDRRQGDHRVHGAGRIGRGRPGVLLVRLCGRRRGRRMPGPPHAVRSGRHGEDRHARRAHYRRAGRVSEHPRVLHGEGAVRQGRRGQPRVPVHSRRPRAERAEDRGSRARLYAAD